MKLLIAICDRGLGEKVVEIIEANKPKYKMVTYGKGTANSEMLNYFGIGGTEKEIILCIIDDEDVNIIFEQLRSRSEFLKHGGAVAFTISINNIGKKTLDYLKSLEGTYDKLEDQR